MDIINWEFIIIVMLSCMLISIGYNKYEGGRNGVLDDVAALHAVVIVSIFIYRE